MASGYPPQGPEARAPAGRARSGRLDDAELLAPPEVDPVQLSRSMFSQPAPRPPPAPLTNQHLKKVARLDATGTSGEGAGADADAGTGGGSGTGGRSGTGAAARVRSVRSARSGRSAAASSVRGGRAAFSIVSDEEVIDVDGEPTTLADDDLDLLASPGADVYDVEDENNAPWGMPHRSNNRTGNLGMSGIGGLGADEYGGPEPLEELEADTPAVRLAEITADLEAAIQAAKDPWGVVQLAQMALGHAKVVWRTMPVMVREEPLLLAKAHFSLAQSYQSLGCDRQASDHGKQALAAIPKEVADTEAARALRSEVQVMRAEVLLSSTVSSGISPEVISNQARKALALLVKAAGLQEPIAWTHEEAEDNELGGIQRTTIDSVTDAGIVALMAQSHGLLAEAKLKQTERESTEHKALLRSAEEAAARLDRRTERGDAFYSPEQQEKYGKQIESFKVEAKKHETEMLKLAAQAERSFDAAMYCLNHVIDIEGSRLEAELGREAKVAHPTFQALWKRSLDFFAGIGAAYAFQLKDAERLRNVNEILSVFAQYSSGGWLPSARHIQALKDKGALLVNKRDYEGATACYEELTSVVTELFENDPLRKELQVAEVLKLRGDVALAGGDFRTAQHMFNQALEFYQRHLGVQAPVAQDLLHRIDEVKGYLADTRVMGRLASFPSRQVNSPLPGAGGAGSAPGGGRSGAPSVASVRTNGSRPPPLSTSGSQRIITALATAASVRSSLDGEQASAGSVGGGAAAASAASKPHSHHTAAAGNAPSSSSTSRPSSNLVAAMSARLSVNGGSGSVHPAESFSGDANGGGVGGWASSTTVPPGGGASSIASVPLRSSGNDLAGHNWAAASIPPSASLVQPLTDRSSRTAADMSAGKAPSVYVASQRSGHGAGSGQDNNRSYGGAASPAALSHRSGYAPDVGAAPSAALLQGSGYGQEGGYGRMASPSVQSQRSGLGGSGAFDGAAASPAAQSHRSGYGPAAPSSIAQSHRSGFSGGGGSGGFDGGAAALVAQSHRSGHDSAAIPTAPGSQRSGYGGVAASMSQSLRSADFSNLRGYDSIAGSQLRASSVIDEDDEGGGSAEEADGVMHGDHFSSTSPSIASASRRLAAMSGDIGSAVSAPQSARSHHSGASGAFNAAFTSAAAQLSRSQRSGVDVDGGFNGATSPAAQSQRSGYGGSAYGGGGGGGYSGSYGLAASPAPPSQRSGEFAPGFEPNSSNSYQKSKNDFLEYY